MNKMPLRRRLLETAIECSMCEGADLYAITFIRFLVNADQDWLSGAEQDAVGASDARASSTGRAPVPPVLSMFDSLGVKVPYQPDGGEG
jgi:hypothetical protein